MSDDALVINVMQRASACLNGPFRPDVSKVLIIYTVRTVGLRPVSDDPKARDLSEQTYTGEFTLASCRERPNDA